jgi:hypothetical protein
MVMGVSSCHTVQPKWKEVREDIKMCALQMLICVSLSEETSVFWLTRDGGNLQSGNKQLGQQGG